MRLLASERLQGTAVNASDTQLNMSDGQGGGSGALLPSHARLQLKTLDHVSTVALRGQCRAVAANLALGIRIPGLVHGPAKGCCERHAWCVMCL
jgi:hypothetical protein